MKVYFVRHGESKFNALRLHQHSEVELTSYGIKQAKTVSKRFKKIPIEIILSSTFIRARQTAAIINKIVKKKIIYTELLKELKRPSEIEGKSMEDLETIKIGDLLKENFFNPNWHYSDEENFFDFKNRVKKFIKELNLRKEKSILVVTHGETMRMIITLMMLNDELTPHVFRQFVTFASTINTGITICEKSEKGKWHLLAWNDHSHLG